MIYLRLSCDTARCRLVGQLLTLDDLVQTHRNRFHAAAGRSVDSVLWERADLRVESAERLKCGESKTLRSSFGLQLCGEIAGPFTQDGRVQLERGPGAGVQRFGLYKKHTNNKRKMLGELSQQGPRPFCWDKFTRLDVRQRLGWYAYMQAIINFVKLRYVRLVGPNRTMMCLCVV